MKEKKEWNPIWNLYIAGFCFLVWIGGQLNAKSQKEAEEAYERVQERKQGISEVYQQARQEDRIYHNFGDI